MRVSDFDFFLPQELIADSPADPREAARLLHIKGDEFFEDKAVADFPGLLREGDLLVFNDTKVIPARLFGRRGEARIEATLFKSKGLTVWEALIKNARRLRENDEISFYPPLDPSADPLKARVLGKTQAGAVVLDFLADPNLLFSLFEKYGVMPLPPYIRRDQDQYARDAETYQTVFAKNIGAVAAPTAGLHFTESLLKKIKDRSVESVMVTLHVGGGTFLPVKAQDTENHVMHAEFGHISEQTASLVTQAKKDGRRIVSVGTTALRLLESAADSGGAVRPFHGETSIFITPGYEFKCIDALFTNFHLPCSTLFMLVSAFRGIKTMKDAYAHAIDRKYRFFSYGDACFIEKAS